MSYIRALGLSDIDQMIEIFEAHDKFQRLPKVAAKSDFGNPSTNINSYIGNIWRDDMNREWSSWFGNFNDNEELTSFIRCRIWKNSHGRNNCTIGIAVKNKDVVHSYMYGQSFFPDDIIDLYNHCVKLAETKDAQAIYHTRNASFSEDSQYKWVPVSDMSACLLSQYNSEALVTIQPNRHAIYSDEMITNNEFIENAFGIYLSTVQKTYRFTKPTS